MLIKKEYKDLSKDELYLIMDIRNEVFVLEQKICYVDTDFKDQKSKHYFILQNNTIISYLRVIDQSVKYDEYAISRVATRGAYRKMGFARKLMNEAINDLKGHPIRISAQAYLKSYYESFGFHQVKEPYIEEGILHIEMLFENK